MKPNAAFIPLFLALLAEFLPLKVVSGIQDVPTPIPSDPIFRALSIDGSIVSGRLRSISPTGRLELVGENGAATVIDIGTIVKLSRPEFVSPRNVTLGGLVVFPGGEQIRGLVHSADEQVIRLNSTVAGQLKIPLESTLGVLINPLSDPLLEAATITELREKVRTSDILILENGDQREIAFVSLNAAEVSYLDADRAIKLPREAVRAVSFDPGLVRLPDNKGLSFDLIMDDGTRFRLFEPTVGGGHLSGLASFGSRVDLTLEHIVDLYILSESITYLSDKEAAREITVPYIGPTRPARYGSSVLGGPLIVGGRRYVRGLGTQSRSLLAYRLTPADRRFQANVALDDAAGPIGNVTFRVLVDGQERFTSPPMTIGEPPMPIDIELSGGQSLILATEFGQGGGVRDFAAWIDPRLIHDRTGSEGDGSPTNAGN